MSTLVRPQELGSRLRRQRLQAGLSLRALAARTEFSPSFISQVEHGQASPSISSLQRIAEALDMSLGQFFAGSDKGLGLVVKRRGRPRIESSWSLARLEALGRARRGGRLEAVLITLRRGGRSGKHPHAPLHDEFVFILSGRVTVELRGATQRLGPGDAVMLPACEPRLLANPGPARAELLLVSST